MVIFFQMGQIPYSSAIKDILQKIYITVSMNDNDKAGKGHVMQGHPG